MTYELAKKLKDAGFPQEGFWFYGSDETDTPCLTYQNNPYDTTGIQFVGNVCKKVVLCTVPTLSELIEACEPYFKTLELVNYLNNTPDTWFTIAYKLAVEYRESGQTAEEAMANLWLKLNAK